MKVHKTILPPNFFKQNVSLISLSVHNLQRYCLNRGQNRKNKNNRNWDWHWASISAIFGFTFRTRVYTGLEFILNLTTKARGGNSRSLAVGQCHLYCRQIPFKLTSHIWLFWPFWAKNFRQASHSMLQVYMEVTGQNYVKNQNH